MRQLFSLTVLCVICTIFTPANFAIAGDGLEIEAGVGVWVPFLPNYQVGAIYDTGAGAPPIVSNIFDDPQTGAGIIFNLSGRQQLGHDISLSMSGFYANANIDSRSNIADPAGADEVVVVDLDGLDFIRTFEPDSMDFVFNSQTQHYGMDVLLFKDHLKETGQFSFGAGFSYMGFTQDFFMMNQSDFFTTMFNETVQSNYYGGKISVMWEDHIHRHPINWDLSVGLYGLDARYSGMNEVHNGDEEGPMMRIPGARDTLSRFAGTVEGHVSTEWSHGIVTIRPRLGFKYLSDMPVINHPMEFGEPAAYLSTSDAFFLTFDLELLVY